MALGNAALPERLHCASVIFRQRAAECAMRKTGLLLISLLGGCMSHQGVRPLRPLEIPTAPYHELATIALTGSLEYEAGCLLFHDDETGGLLLPVWPTGSTFNGTALQFHKPGKADQRIMVAEEFQMAGQPLQWTTLGAPTYQQFQRQCGAAPFFVSATRQAN
jgi:hypothetical protein